MDNYRQHFKERLNTFCQKNKIRQNKMSSAIGLRRQTVNRWFYYDNDTMPNFEAIKWLKDNYGLNVDWLIGGEK